VTGWKLGPLARLRAAEARAAARRSVERALRAQAEEAAAAEVEERAGALRGLARERLPIVAPAGGEWTACQLATASDGRGLADREARRLWRAAERARIRAAAERALAGREAVLAAVARGRADALARGEARFLAAARSAEQAAHEREVEEAWAARSAAGGWR
jgi:hypothetical protein